MTPKQEGPEEGGREDGSPAVAAPRPPVAEAPAASTDTREKALEEAARLADEVQWEREKHANASVYEEKFAAQSAADVAESIAAAIRALKEIKQ